jgi:glycerophosphoryl diester phosphodiesterase
MFRRAVLITTTMLVAVLSSGMSSADAATAISSRHLLRSSIENVAHRGASHYAPENTMAAVKEAAERNATLFEIDVQLSKDKQLVLMHDTNLARTTDAEQVFPDRAPWNVGDFTLAELRKLDAGSWFDAKFKGERIPTLGQTLREMKPAGLGLLLEVKSPELYPGIGGRLAAELLRHPSWSDKDPRGRRLIIQSFDWDFIRAFKPLMPWLPHGLLGTPPTEQLPELAEFADQINPSHGTIDADYVAQVHKAGMETFAWTINDEAGMRRAIDLKVDGIITNRPDVLHGVLGGRRAAAA